VSWLVRGPARPLLVGVVHLGPLPGAPRWAGDIEAVLERARADAEALVQGDADALLVENFGDMPFHGGAVPAETVAAMALAVESVTHEARGRPVGVNVLRNDARASLGLCAATSASFLRVNVHSGAMLTDQGLIEGRAAETLRERARLCPSTLILADVHVKHAVALAARPIAEVAEETFVRALADALIVSGARTGDAPSVADLAQVRERVPRAPLLVGSGLSPSNARELCAHCDGGIVGTSLKRDGRVEEAVDPARVRRLREILDRRW
jgi:membrane complex biogenesis BtpA family protein